MGFISRAFAPFLPGQMLAHEPQPVQSSVDTVIAKLSPGTPVIGSVSIPSGAFFSSFVKNRGRITACGHT